MFIRAMILTTLLVAPVNAVQTVHLALMPTGTADKIGGSYYISLNLSDTRPAAIKKVPVDLSDHPLYGMLKFNSSVGSEIAVVVDSPPGKPSRLFVDTNGDGDLTNDPDTQWVAGTDFKGTVTGMKPTQLGHVGGAMLKTGSAGKTTEAHIGMWMYKTDNLKGQTDTRLDELHHTLMYYRDYCTAGNITVAGKEHQVFLLDELCTGQFTPTGPRPLVRLFIDLNDNGKIDTGEMFDVTKPIKIDGHVYEAKDVAADGTSFSFGDSDKAGYSPDDVKVGQIAPTFNAEDLEQIKVSFPGTYKGKIVLLDFWATWCFPCMAEVPTIVADYGKYHDKGFEILGVTLDQPEEGDKVKRVTGEHKMAWPQLFGGSGKTRTIAEMYSVNAIPSAFLVDGSTGKILAAGNELRGDGLEKMLAKFVVARQSGE